MEEPSSDLESVKSLLFLIDCTFSRDSSILHSFPEFFKAGLAQAVTHYILWVTLMVDTFSISIGSRK
jgi:hypothetical protein